MKAKKKVMMVVTVMVMAVLVGMGGFMPGMLGAGEMNPTHTPP